MASKHPTPDHVFDLLARCEPFAQLPSAALQDLAAHSVARERGRGARLATPGVTDGSVLVLVDGVAAIHGNPGPLLGFVSGPCVLGDAFWASETSWAQVVRAETACTYIAIPYKRFNALLAATPAFATVLYRDACRRHLQLLLAVQAAASLDPRRRFLRLIGEYACLFGEASAEGLRIDVPLSKMGLARALGASRRTIHRCIDAARADGLLDETRKRITLTDPDKFLRLLPQDTPSLSIRYGESPEPCAARLRKQLAAQALALVA